MCSLAASAAPLMVTAVANAWNACMGMCRAAWCPWGLQGEFGGHGMLLEDAWQMPTFQLQQMRKEHLSKLCASVRSQLNTERQQVRTLYASMACIEK